ncbi:P-loop containing nucleoside triphosphate hydrolase protein [Kickxella alabastrina]|uniref:P-loop containing nucleoside triphosphate hydrolase protein n=1 Tax=Kickxella alabastrina TaxID=61397 RepID=UPI00221F1E35|nr:P-loop containing nucleoside triphosphate hydrolase protein [Kickxella alabastrina]KAI7824961.1 P-loop containing nucleoside triphosphate hydrolase protein [Kickxella alabastrina]
MKLNISQQTWVHIIDAVVVLTAVWHVFLAMVFGQKQVYFRWRLYTSHAMLAVLVAISVSGRVVDAVYIARLVSVGVLQSLNAKNTRMLHWCRLMASANGCYRAVLHSVIIGRQQEAEAVLGFVFHGLLIYGEVDGNDCKALSGSLRNVFLVQPFRMAQRASANTSNLLHNWDIGERFAAKHLLSEFTFDPHQRFFVVRAIARMMAPAYVPIFLAEQTLSLAQYIDAVLMGRLLAEIDKPQTSSLTWCLLLVGSLGVARFVQGQDLRVNNWRMGEIKRITKAIELAIFLAPLQAGAGPLQNAHMFRFGNHHPEQLVFAVSNVFMHVSALLTAIISVVTIAYSLGTGVAVASALVVLFIYVATKLGYLVLEYATARWFVLQPYDCVDEICSNITSIKLHAWEEKYLRWAQTYVDDDGESSYPLRLRVVRYVVNTSLIVLQSSAKCIAVLVAFMMYDAANGSYNGARLQQMRQQIHMLSGHIGLVFGSTFEWRSVRESNRILALSLRAERRKTIDRMSNDSNTVVRLTDCDFSWDATAPNVLSGVSFAVTSGQLVAVCGPVGQGKSALLQALCGELDLIRGTGYTSAATIAYVAQRPFIMADSVQANILFGRTLDADRYQRVLWACALDEEIGRMPAGDQTPVGNGGLGISGGQRARLALARAAYAADDAELILLDDPLAAVDTKVARTLLSRLILGPMALLSGKACVLVTNNKKVLPFAHQVVSVVGGQATVIKQVPRVYQHMPELDKASPHQTFHSTLYGAAELQSKCPEENTADPVPNTTAEVDKATEAIAEAENAFMYLFRICGYTIIVGTAVYALVVTFAWRASQLWLLQAQRATVISPSTVTALWYLQLDLIVNVYRGLLFALDGYLSTYTAQYLCAPRINHKFFSSILHSPLSYFASEQQHSRISNGFYNSAHDLQSSIPVLFRMEVTMLVTIYNSLWHAWQFSITILLTIIPVTIGIYYLEQWLSPARTALCRLGTQTNIGNSHMRTTVINAGQTVRLLQTENHFRKAVMDQFDRDTQRLQAMWGYYNLFRCIQQAISQLTALAAIVVVLVKQRTQPLHMPGDPDSITSAEVMHIISTVGKLIYSMTTIIKLPERLVDYVELVNNYKSFTQLQPQPQTTSTMPATLPDNWPSNGKVEFSDYSMRYSADQPRALDGISLTIRPGEKIGIVGRTGAGKSSLAKALFRLTEADSGKILIDEMDISSIPLNELRSRLAIIPQESALFFGSIRDNLDPLQQHTLEDLWSAIIKAQLVDLVNRKEVTEIGATAREKENEVFSLFDLEQERTKTKTVKNSCWRRINIESTSPVLRSGLDKWIDIEGRNFSIGQRQLVGLCRGLLKSNRKILVLDEATADVDATTDNIIHGVIRKEFKHSTVITIAHRVNTVIDSDRVVVLDKGRIVEVDTPGNLLKRDSMFARLALDNN